MGEKETLNPAIIAKVGNGAGTVVVSGRSGWIYVRLHGDDNQLTEAKLGIPLDTGSLNDAWVRVKKASPRKASYYVVEEFITSSTGDPAPPMSAHPLDPDAGPHVGTLPEDDVAFDDAAGHDHQGAGNKGKKVDHGNLLGLTDPDHDVKDMADSEGRLLTGVQKTDLTDGGPTTLHQHAGATTAAVEIVLTNQTGGERSSGDVVVTDPNNDESFIGTSGSGYQGKVLVVAETIPTSGSGLCWERGGPFNIEVVGAVDRNDGLRTSATIYRAAAAPSITGGGVFAVALSPNISGEGTVKAVFLDAIGAGGGDGDGDGGAWTLIEDIDLAGDGAIDFQNIPGTYKHLKLIISVRSDAAAVGDELAIRFNNSAVGYDWVKTVHKGNGLLVGDSINADRMVLINIPGNNAPANSFGCDEIVVPDYADSSKKPSAYGHGGAIRNIAANEIWYTNGAGGWRTQGAVTRITFVLTNGVNFKSGSRATLYGIN